MKIMGIAWSLAFAWAVFPGATFAEEAGGSAAESRVAPPRLLAPTPTTIPAAWLEAGQGSGGAQASAMTLSQRASAPLAPVSFADVIVGPDVQTEPESSYEPHATYAGCASCLPPWAHRTGLFGEVLYLRARDAEVAYVVPIDGAIVPPPAVPIQVGPTGVTDPDYSTGYRLGGVWALDHCSSVVLTYTRFETATSDSQAVAAPLVLRSLVFHPSTANAGSDFLDANARLGIDLSLADLDYRAVWDAGDFWAINYLVGARYAHLNQDFAANFTGDGTLDSLATNVNFDGGGIRVGVDGERHAGAYGVFLYGKATANFVGGEFRGRYTQSSNVDPVIVDTSWTAGRLVSILDLELGAGWQSACGRWRLSAGYMVNSWLNVVTTDDWIGSVQTNNFGGLGSTMTFDGLVGRVEFRF